MREEGVEPSRLAAQEPKSCVSASSTTLALWEMGRPFRSATLSRIIADLLGFPKGQ